MTRRENYPPITSLCPHQPQYSNTPLNLFSLTGLDICNPGASSAIICKYDVKAHHRDREGSEASVYVVWDGVTNPGDGSDWSEQARPFTGLSCWWKQGPPLTPLAILTQVATVSQSVSQSDWRYLIASPIVRCWECIFLANIPGPGPVSAQYQPVVFKLVSVSRHLHRSTRGHRAQI